MIDHIPWPDETPLVGSISGQRIALMGYSHYGESDNNDYTHDVISEVLQGRPDPELVSLRRISGYFCDLGYATAESFWSNVTFFNYLPECIGEKTEKYRNGSPEQIARAKLRLLRILRNVNPEKLLIFTSKSRQLPLTDQQRAGQRRNPVLGPDFPTFWRGTYDVGANAPIPVFKLRHPLFAPGELMRSAIKLIMEEDTLESSPRQPVPGTVDGKLSHGVVEVAYLQVGPVDGAKGSWSVMAGLPRPEPLLKADNLPLQGQPSRIAPRQIAVCLDHLANRLEREGTNLRIGENVIVRDRYGYGLLVRHDGSWEVIEAGTALHAKAEPPRVISHSGY